MPFEMDLFLGLSATAWAAFAAGASFLASAVAAFLTAITLRAESIRPEVKVEIGAVKPGVLHSSLVKAWIRRPDTWPASGLEVVIVTIINGGRTPLTSQVPAYELRLAWWHPKQWWRNVNRWQHTVTPTVFPWRGCVTSDSIRIEPFDSVKYVMDLTPLFSNRALVSEGKWHSWRVVRVVVPISGRRPVRARPRINAHSGMPQLSGADVTLDQFLRRWFMRQSLLSGPPADGGVKARRAMPLDAWDSHQSHAIAIEEAVKENGGRITRALLIAAMPVGSSEDDHGWPVFQLGVDLVEAGFTTLEDLRSEPLPVRAAAPYAPTVPITPRQRMGRALAVLGARIAGRPY